MQLFKSILDTSAAAREADNKRRAPRYALTDSFPFRTKLTLFKKDGAAISDEKGKDWSTTPVNLSAKGGSFQLSLAAVAFQRDACRIKFSKGDFNLEIPGTIAHYRCYSHYSLAGVLFTFPDMDIHASYLQLLEPVIIGNSLVPVDAQPDASGWHKEQFGGDKLNALSVWRGAPGQPIKAFELRMHHYIVRWTEGAAELQLLGIDEASIGGPITADTPLYSLTEEQYEEVRWLFSYVIPNLSNAVPADVRKFFASLVPK